MLLLMQLLLTTATVVVNAVPAIAPATLINVVLHQCPFRLTSLSLQVLLLAALAVMAAADQAPTYTPPRPTYSAPTPSYGPAEPTVSTPAASLVTASLALLSVSSHTSSLLQQ